MVYAVFQFAVNDLTGGTLDELRGQAFPRYHSIVPSAAGIFPVDLSHPAPLLAQTAPNGCFLRFEDGNAVRQQQTKLAKNLQGHNFCAIMN